MHLQPRESGHEAQQRANWADGVAVGAAATPCQHRNCGKKRNSRGKHRHTLYPHLFAVEGVTVVVLRKGGKGVVAPQVKRLKQIADDGSVGSVRRKQRDDSPKTKRNAHHKHGKHRVAKHILRRAVGEAVFLLFAVNPRNQVLHHPKRANHRAIHTAKNEREQHQRHYHHHIQSQHGWQKLHFRHPAEPLVRKASEIKQQQCNQHIKHSRQHYSNFP